MTIRRDEGINQSGMVFTWCRLHVMAESLFLARRTDRVILFIIPHISGGLCVGKWLSAGSPPHINGQRSIL